MKLVATHPKALFLISLVQYLLEEDAYPIDNLNTLLEQSNIEDSLKLNALKLRATLQGRSGRHKEAIEDLNAALDTNPDERERIQLLILLGKNYGINNHKKARKCLTEASKTINDLIGKLELAGEPPDRELIRRLISLSESYTRIAENEKAIECLAKAGEAISKNLESSSSKNELIDLLVSLGINYGAINRHQKAIDLFTKAYELETSKDKKIILLQNCGIAKRTLGKNAEAVEDFSAALKLEESQAKRANLFYNRGIAFAGEKEVEKAINDFNDALKENLSGTLRYELLRRRGDLYLSEKKYKKAIEGYNLLLEKEGLTHTARIDILGTCTK